MWSDAATAVQHLDQLVRSGRITGWGFEQSIAYLGASHPTMSYRMYRGQQDQDTNLGAFIREIAPTGALIAVSEAEGSVDSRTGWRPPASGTVPVNGVWRSRQVVLTISFETEPQLWRAAEVVAEHFTRRPGPGHQPGSWWVPDARVSGTATCPPGMVPALAHSRRTGDGHFVVLSAAGPAPFTGARTHELFLPEPFGAFLRG
ncbi:MAG TPA: hypothetical protein VGR61_03780 [Candidatus Dormibacteraeota bacterium]|nr:hypothetical protein [Candidatus Dormibacteraeota bacterium]